ncbi:concanavalin A-like lectin/glucanase domain-containing protein [Mycena sp. CBHHK59/15]|nr:concanavalin A-like lectin/glucanase domain-containing protein [Mycena sp. CBHHK59/15]
MPPSTPPAPRDPFADSLPSTPAAVSSALPPASPAPGTRMRSTALPPAAPYAAVAKPWTLTPNPRARISYFLTYALVAVGAALGGVQAYFAYTTVRLDRQPLCLVFDEAFDAGDDAGVFGSENGKGRWLREVQMDGFGNGEFQMTTASSNNSFLQNGNLYLVPTLTPGWPFADGTSYNSTDCTFNITAPNNGFNIPSTNGGAPTFDYDGYYATCSRTTNSTAGTIVNPVQSARLSTFISAGGDESTKSKGSLRYGRVEVRAKMPTGDWLWPAIWMLPVNNTYGPWPRSGEIDIVESRGNGIAYTNRGANYVQGSLNWGPSPALNGVGHSYSWWTEKRTPFSAGFHTYALEWTDRWLRVYFPATVRGADGQLAALQNPWANGTGATPFDQDFYLIMNIAVGSTNGWFPDGQGDKPWLDRAGNPPVDFIKGKSQWYPTWPQNVEDRAMVVDYVKMWKHC